MKNTCLILIAHSSKEASWQKHLIKIVSKLEGKLKGQVLLAYLNPGRPTLQEVVNKLIRNEVKKICILPLFMGPGKHTNKDIPNEVREIKRRYKDLTIKLLPAIGNDPVFVSAIINLAKTHLNKI